ncbi:MAG TPA: hypothetical protein VL400_14540, partial [Polyangiaceae bacterium]|nr:hypothetical protein [Polyangiaceae bacterium]
PGRPSAPPVGSEAPSPSDGVAELEGERDVDPHTGRRRWAIALAAVLVVAPAVAFGASRWLRSNAETASVDEDLSRAESAMQRRAWDTPPHENVKELTDDALARSPGDRRVLTLRRNAAEQIVNDALGRKYAGNSADALRLARLALELSPELTTAQHLVRELETPEGAPSIAPEPEPTSTATSSVRAPTHGAGSAPTSKASASAKTSASAPPAGGQELPPQPPPDLTPPPPSSSRPWL